MDGSYEIGDTFLIGSDSVQTKYTFPILYWIPEVPACPVHEIDLQFVTTGWPPKTFSFAFYNNFVNYVLGRPTNFINKFMFDFQDAIWT